MKRTDSYYKQSLVQEEQPCTQQQHHTAAATAATAATAAAAAAAAAVAAHSQHIFAPLLNILNRCKLKKMEACENEKWLGLENVAEGRPASDLSILDNNNSTIYSDTEGCVMAKWSGKVGVSSFDFSSNIMMIRFIPSSPLFGPEESPSLWSHPERILALNSGRDDRSRHSS
ncbi:unnamed protein product [Acanthocheilonema viteae]|uniref:Uncharacterized protein n=1 Tax=Acanthocheilonema viteae TaxID=6277 RepID=A0A498SMB2_ACAVI|nr:unnamed protein product [Acanthocheilonema viteae]